MSHPSSGRSWALFSVPTLAAAVLFSAVVVLPFLPLAKSRANFFWLETQFTTSAAGAMQVYYDVGAGIRETDSARAPFPAGHSGVLRIPLPAGTYHSLRLDPLDGAGSLQLTAPPRIVTRHGRTVHTIEFGRIRPQHEIASVRAVPGSLEIVTTPDAKDPQLVLSLPGPVAVDLTVVERFAGFFPRAGAVFIVVLAGVWLLSRTAGTSTRGRSLHAWILRRPRRAIGCAALGGVIASAYPVIFLGKSFVSPNYGTALLYPSYPTLPGYANTRSSHDTGSDVGAAIYQHVPYSMMEYHALREGGLPWWNRHTTGGTPLLAQAQSMWGDPLNLFVVLCRGAAWAWDVKYLACKALFAVGLGLLVLRFTHPGDPSGEQGAPAASVYSAMLVALAASFAGFFLYRINHPAIFSLCYAPWVLYAWLRLASANGLRAIAWSLAGLLGANFILFNSGTAKEALLLLLQMNAAGAVVLLAGCLAWRDRLLRLAGAAWVGALLALLCAPVWMTFLQALPEAHTSYQQPLAFQIQPSLALGVFDELFFRPLSRNEGVFNPGLNFLLLLGLLCFLSTLRSHWSARPVIALALCSAVGAAFVFGVVSPLWIARVPLLANVAHIENCFLCGLIVFWSVLAGVGFSTVAGRLRSGTGGEDLVRAGILLLVIVAAWIGFWHASHRTVHGPGSTLTVVPAGAVLPVSGFVWATLGLLLLAAAAVALIARRASLRGRLGPAGVLVLLLAVVIFLWRQGMHPDAVGFAPYGLRPQVRADFQARSTAVEFARTAQQAQPGRVMGVLNTLMPGWSAGYGLESIHGPDALQNARLHELLVASPLTWSGWRILVFPAEVAKYRRLLDAFNIRHYFDVAANRSEYGNDVRLVHSSDLDVYESPTAWPRAFFCNQIETYAEPADLVRVILGGDGRPFAAVQQGDRLAAERLEARGTARTTVPAADYRLGSSSTSFTVRATGQGIIVLTEALWPGHVQVEVNGRAVNPTRVNHAFIGIPVSTAGDYAVTCRYVPRDRPAMLTLAATGLLLALASLAFAHHRGRPRAGVPVTPRANVPLAAGRA